MPVFQEEAGSQPEEILDVPPIKAEEMDETTVMFPDISVELGDSIMQDISNQVSPTEEPQSANTSILEDDFLERFPAVNFPSNEASSTPEPSPQKKRVKGPQTIAGYLIPAEESATCSQAVSGAATQDTVQETFKRPRDPDDPEVSNRNKRLRRDENDNETQQPGPSNLAQMALQPILQELAAMDEDHPDDRSQLEGYEDSEADATDMDGTNNEDMPFPNLDIDFDVDAMLKQYNQGIRTGTMGEKQLQRYYIEKRLVLQCIKQLHNCLKNAPTEVTEVDPDPEGLAVPLMPHQRQAMRWMKWREEQQPCSGGILADEMGLGKTLQMIALILAAKNEARAKLLAEDPEAVIQEDFEDAEDWGSLDSRQYYEGKTLVVCPPSLMEQWEREITTKCNQGVLHCYIYHGVENKHISEGRLCKYDVVITTYHTVGMDYKSHMQPEEDKYSPLFRIKWNRVALDEAHIIRNHRGKFCEAVCELKGTSKWAITGTPIQNRERDFFPLLKYLNCEPFVELSLWNRWIRGKLGDKRLIIITKTLMLRRTKQELVEKNYIKALPEKHFRTINVEMDPEEMIVYQKLLLYSQSFFMEFLRNKEEKEQEKLFPRSFASSTSLIAQHVPKKLSRMMRTLLRHHSHEFPSDYLLVLIMRLRQLCCHPALIKGMLDKEDTDLDDVEGGRDIQRMDNNILEYISKVINEEEANETDEDCDDDDFELDENTARNLMTSENPLFNDDRKSSKVRAILKTIQEILNVGEKVVVVSQWTSFLQVIGNNLARMRDAKFAVFSGKTKLADRMVMVDRLNDYDDKLNVLLLSLTAGAVGLNLVGANHLLIIDNHWNPQLEAQAQDRLHRFGQFNDVHIYRFICTNTIEEKIVALQAKKLQAASKVLDGKVADNLTIKDLATLFS